MNTGSTHTGWYTHRYSVLAIADNGRVGGWVSRGDGKRYKKHLTCTILIHMILFVVQYNTCTP